MSAEEDFSLISLKVSVGALSSVHLKGNIFQTQIESYYFYICLKAKDWDDSAYHLTHIVLSLLEQTTQKVFIPHILFEWKYTEELNLLWFMSQKNK